MSFTPEELSSIANAALDFHFKGQPLPQSIQDKPLLGKLETGRKNFPGGKGDITRPIKGKFEFEGGAAVNPGDLTGYTHDDTVQYGNIAGIERARYPWREVHTGWNCTLTELKIDGISVTDSSRGTGERSHSKREMTAITNIMEDKVETFGEIIAKQMNNMFWGDGTADPLGFLGVQYFITATPAVGVTGGLDRAIFPWWRNRYLVMTAATDDMPVLFNSEWRQLRRYGGRPDCVLAGSDFLDALNVQLLAKGNYTDRGWNRSDATEMNIADISFNGIKFMYDPTLDDLGLAGSCFVIDSRRLFCYAMDMEWGKDHNPARPHDIYAMFKARTYTGQMIATQLNCHGRYDLA
jgi:hypothetical protein